MSHIGAIRMIVNRTRPLIPDALPGAGGDTCSTKPDMALFAGKLDITICDIQFTYLSFFVEDEPDAPLRDRRKCLHVLDLAHHSVDILYQHLDDRRGTIVAALQFIYTLPRQRLWITSWICRIGAVR
jgi:hypothetical protein